MEEFFFEFVNLYIYVDKVLSKDGLLFFYYFNEVLYNFKVVIGVDGVLFGKDDEVIVWFFFFINVGE